MSDDAFAYSTTVEVLMDLAVEEAVQESGMPECPAYADAFAERGAAAKAAGDHEVARAWFLLANLCRVALRPSEPSEPFQPLWQEPGGRTMVPGDMDEKSAVAVRQLGFAATDGELRARLLDVTWDRLRDAEAAREAVRSYVAAANVLFDPEHWTTYAARVERATRLARQLGDRGQVDRVLGEIEERIVELDGADPLFLTCHLMELLLEFRHGDPAAMRDIASKGAGYAEVQGDFERARTYHELVGRWCRRAGDDAGEKAARTAEAASLRRQGEQSAGREEDLVAMHWLEKAHEAYRNIPGMRETVSEVYAQLRESQRRAVNQMSRISTEVPNGSELIKHARDCVAGKSLREALLALAIVVRVTDFEQESEIAQEIMERYPLQGLLGGLAMGHSGLVVARTRPAWKADAKEFELALWERLVRHLDLRYQLIVKNGIVPAVNQLNFEHPLVLEDLLDLIVDNPLVPPGHEELFARGFLAGFRWNLAESLSILVPQLENSLRHALARAGREVTTRDKHGLQNFIQMGRVLSEYREDLEAMFGNDIVQELRALFVDQNGADLRNQIAHGLMRQEQFFHHTSIYAWWFIFHLTICPVRERFLNAGEVADHGADGGEADGSNGE